MMKTKEFVDSLFNGYEETSALADFKEELLGNLNAKMESLAKKGMDEQAAFEKASAELGDVSVLADELSLKKRKEVFEEAYMGVSRYMSAGRVAGYVIFGVLAFFGIITALIALFAIKAFDIGLDGSFDWTGFFATMMPFFTAAIAGFTFLAATQETASMYPVSKKRAAWYTAAAALIAFGLLTMPIVYFSIKIADEISSVIFGYNLEALIPVMGMLIPFVLPGIGMLVFLVLTEKDRLKPWAKDFRDKTVKREMEMWNDPSAAMRFGIFSGAIWIFAVGLFLLLGFLIGFKFSWLVFIFATAFQLLIQGVMSKPQAK
jgi:hypothetical protein